MICHEYLCHIFTVGQMTQIVRRHQQAAVDTSSAIVAVFTNTKYKIQIWKYRQAVYWIGDIITPPIGFMKQYFKSNTVFLSLVWVLMTQKDNPTKEPSSDSIRLIVPFSSIINGCRSSFGSCDQKKGSSSNSRNAFVVTPLFPLSNNHNSSCWRQV